jgi:predicted nucleotide-binding protein (sugar kinase/HSP70/actin superfamily)
MSEELKKEWEVQFENKVNNFEFQDGFGGDEFNQEKIKSFISEILAKQQEEFVKIVIEIIKEYGNKPHRNVGIVSKCSCCGSTLDDLLADIKSKLNI